MTMQGWGVKTIAGLGMFAGWFLACAGDDIPPIEDELRGALAANFGGASMVVGSAGSSGSGTGGRGGSGSGTSGNSGSANTSGSSGGGAAGSGSEPVGGGGSGDFCDAYPIIEGSCALGGSGCHGEGSGQGAFAVGEDGVLDFVDRPSTKGNACDQLFIDSTNPEDSLIYTRLFAADCGGTLQMPAAGDLLTEEQSDCVLSWLQQFAE
jgi:hypothetical protein